MYVVVMIRAGTHGARLYLAPLAVSSVATLQIGKLECLKVYLETNLRVPKSGVFNLDQIMQLKPRKSPELRIDQLMNSYLSWQALIRYLSQALYGVLDATEIDLRNIYRSCILGIRVVIVVDGGPPLKWIIITVENKSGLSCSHKYVDYQQN